MSSPPQGFIANQLTAGGFFIRHNPSANGLDFTNEAGTTVLRILIASGGAIQIFGSYQFQSQASNRLADVVAYDNIATAGEGLIPVYGLDNRSGLVAADGAPITLYTTTGALELYRITADIFATVVSAGTANYTLTWTENAQAKTMVVSASVVNTLATATDLINPDTGTAITAQLTFAGFTGTVKVASFVEQIT